MSLFAKLRADGYHTVTGAHDARPPARRRRAYRRPARPQADDRPARGRQRRAARRARAPRSFLRHALVPVPAAEQERYFLKTKVVSPNELDTVKLSDFETVILADVVDLPTRSLEDLSSYLKRGGGLIIFPGPHTNAAFYNQELLNKYHFLPAALGDAHGDADQGKATTPASRSRSRTTSTRSSRSGTTRRRVRSARRASTGRSRSSRPRRFPARRTRRAPTRNRRAIRRWCCVSPTAARC